MQNIKYNNENSDKFTSYNKRMNTKAGSKVMTRVLIRSAKGQWSYKPACSQTINLVHT